MTSRGFASLIGLLIVVGIIGLLAYVYLYSAKQAGTTRDEQKEAIDAALQIKNSLESRSFESQ